MNAAKLIVTKSNLHIGNASKFYTAKARYNDVNFNITYDCTTGNVTIHEWYKFNNYQLSIITAQLNNFFENTAA